LEKANFNLIKIYKHISNTITEKKKETSKLKARVNDKKNIRKI